MLSKYLEMDSSDIAKNEFINNCQTWHINCLFSRSEELIIERLLQFQKYDIALHYIHRLEVKGGNIYKFYLKRRLKTINKMNMF